MNRATATVVAAAALVLTSCSGGTDTTKTDASKADAPKGTTAETPSTSQSGSEQPTYSVLPKKQLQAALLTIQDVPVGYSVEPASEPGPTKTFCDYKPPFTEKVHVFREFTKGGGLSAEMVRVGLRQYESADKASAAFDALTEALSTCRGETYQGSELEYAALSAPKVGDESVGVRIKADEYTVLQNFVLVGPTVVSTGGGGLVQADADEIASLVEAQVDAYQNVAAG